MQRRRFLGHRACEGVDGRPTARYAIQALTEDLVKQTLRDYIVQVAGLAAAPANDDLLVEHGFVASVRLLDLVGFLEDTFKVRMRPVDLVPENLATIHKLATVVMARITQKR
jgi:acyl carrier protein